MTASEPSTGVFIAVPKGRCVLFRNFVEMPPDYPQPAIKRVAGGLLVPPGSCVAVFDPCALGGFLPSSRLIPEHETGGEVDMSIGATDARTLLSLRAPP